MIKEIVSFKGISYFADTEYCFTRWFRHTENSIFYIDVGGVEHLLFLASNPCVIYDFFKDLEEFYRYSDFKKYTFPSIKYFVQE